MLNQDAASRATNIFIMGQFGGKASTQKLWDTMEHQGVMFPLPYRPHGIPVLYQGKPIKLEPLAEEAATMYARRIEMDYPKVPTYRKNFWNDWKAILGKDHPIKNLNDVDFRQIHQYLTSDAYREQAKQIRIQEKERAEQYQTIMIDGKPEKAGNFRVEPSDIFLGRGPNPKLGKIKPHLTASDFTLNLSEGAPIPKPPPGQKWGAIVHDHTAQWIASWQDKINNKPKYVGFAADAKIKGNEDLGKFELAKQLKKQISKIRSQNEAALSSTKPKLRQVATAMYLIDTLALRVGGEKSADQTDTVGVTSLRVEHLKLLPGRKLSLDFLGKDSVRYQKQIVLPEKVYQSMEALLAGKAPSDQLFHSITARDINRYLQELMPGLSAKVFRTYSASDTFQKEIDKIDKEIPPTGEPITPAQLILLKDRFALASVRVADLCNHQKNVAKGASASIDKARDVVKERKQKWQEAVQAEKSAQVIHKAKLAYTNAQNKLTIKKQLKNLSTGTSKASYIDPRISVAFAARHGIPIQKLFTKAHLDKFRWATEMEDASEYRF